MRIITTIIILFQVHDVIAQNPQTSRLKHELSLAKEDTSRVLLLSDISISYRNSNPDSSMHYGQRALDLARRINWQKGEGRGLARVSLVFSQQGNNLPAYKYNLEAYNLNVKVKDWEGAIQTLNNIGLMYLALQNPRDVQRYLLQALKVFEENKIPDDINLITSLGIIQASYRTENRLDSAKYYLSKAFEIHARSKYKSISPFGDPLPTLLREFGSLEERLGRPDNVLPYYRESILHAKIQNDIRALALGYRFMAEWFKKKNQSDSAVYYAKVSLANAYRISLTSGILQAANLLSDLYRLEKNNDSILKYISVAALAKDSLFSPKLMQQLQLMNFSEQERVRQVQEEQERFNNRVKIYGLSTGLLILLSGGFILWRNNRQRKKANIMLQKQKDELQATLNLLTSTQAQLIQSEKMASLGELTAGIAHEIQNPLNFVNNFSEVNKELIEELHEEQKKEPRNFQKENEILSIIEQNLEKTNHHGKRADGIIKGMLQHSRISSGQKEPTNINALADEYLRLAYHGLRAKDKSFNSTLKTDFDETIGNINIIPQDIGRVVLNLINNAFYAVDEKKKQQPTGYEPTVSISTKKVNARPDDPVGSGKVEIKVRDNGNGIPQNVLDKIFQPFFTTKPTGQGTGLGLSLAYDIIKAHGGELRVETKDNEGSGFIIQLPSN